MNLTRPLENTAELALVLHRRCTQHAVTGRQSKNLTPFVPARRASPTLNRLRSPLHDAPSSHANPEPFG